MVRRISHWLDALEGKLVTIDRRLVVAFLVVLIAPLFRPDLLSHVDDKTFVNIYKYWGLVSGVCSVALFVILGRRGPFAYTAVLLIASVLLSTFIFGGKINRWFVYWLPSATMALLVASTCRCFYRELLMAVLAVTLVLEIFNFGSVLVFPEGMWETDKVAKSGNFFFDHRNNAYKLLFPMLLCSALLDQLRSKRVGVRTVLLTVLAYAQVLLAPSATSLVALTLLVVFFLLVQWEIVRRVVNGFTLLAASFFSFIFIVVLRFQDALSFFVVDALHKNLTFTGRTFVWDKVFEMFDDVFHILFGYGVSGYKDLVIDGRPYSHAHNEFLDVWLNGGLVAVVFLLLMLFLLSRALFELRTRREVAILAVAVGAYYVIGLTEPIISVSFLFVTSTAFYRCWQDRRKRIGPIAS